MSTFPIPFLTAATINSWGGSYSEPIDGIEYDNVVINI